MLGQEENGRNSPGAIRKTYLRSASWSDRSPSNPNPRQHSNSKVRSCLPPLSISRRSVEEWPRAGSDDLGEWPHHPPTPGARPGSFKPHENSNTERPPREFQLKKDKLAFFDKECSRIADHIYLGSEAVAKNREILRKNGITHVLNCVGFVCPEYFKTDLVYKTLWLQDTPSEDITSILYDVFDYFEDVREQGGRVLVHCCQGVSRSTALVIAYLMWRDGQSFEDAFQYVKAARGVTNPNMGFACQLLQCQKRVHAVPVSPNSVLRMYRMAPHSPYDPLHLVPKMLHHPGPLGLDSRGAFIVHVPTAIYVWVGKNCNPVMASNARASASQVIRYERAQGQIVIVKEGREPLDFWDALASGPLLGDDFDKVQKVKEEVHGVGGWCARKDQVTAAMNLEVGKKKLVEYDVDFEIFQKALCGGVVPPFPLSGTGSETLLPARENGWGKLRQKFASGVVKGLVTVSKLTNHTDQSYNSPDEIMDCKDMSVPSADTLSSPSPPCGSPDSFSCYSNMSPKSSSKSPSPSLSDHSSLFTFSPASSNWSDYSSFSSQPSPSALEFREPFTAKHTSQSEKDCLPRKGSSPSLAERRGSNPPSLMLLPPINDPPRVSRRMIRSWSFSLPSSEEAMMMDNEYHEPEDSNELSTKGTSNLFSAGNEVKTGITDANELGKLHLASKNLINEVVDLTHPVLFQWPTIEKVDMLQAGVFDSRSVFLLLSPNVNLAMSKPKILYIWVGRDAQLDEDKIHFIGSDSTDEDRHVYWEKVGCNFLNHIGLPMDTPVQMISEGEESGQFLDHLNGFSFHQAQELS